MATKFITISIEIMHDKNLTQTEKFILAEIEQLSSLEDGCHAQNKHFAELTGIAKVTVSRAIHSLEAKGYITSETKPGSRNHVRLLTINKMIRPPIQNDKTPLTKRYETKGNIQSNIQSNIQVEIPSSVQEWVDYRKEINKPIQKTTIKSLIKQYNESPTLFIEKVDHSIASGYQGLYAPKQQSQYKSKAEVGSLGWMEEQETLDHSHIIDINIEDAV